MTIDVRLQTLSDGAEELTVSKESVAELKDILNDSSIIENQNLIIERFEKEHSFYITLITILSILLTVFGIVPVVYGLFEKSESQKIYSELETLKRQYKEQLKIARFQHLIDTLQKQDDYLRKFSSLLLENSKEVNSMEEFELYMRKSMKAVFANIDITDIDKEFFNNFCIYFYNLMYSSLAYCNFKFNANYNLQEKIKVLWNPVLNTMIVQLQTVLPDEKFVELKEYIQNMPKSIFDFTGF